jgi:hypothetical protein
VNADESLPPFRDKVERVPDAFFLHLYRMISDPKSAQFIAWTELGTSFVVSNVGEFSRSILGGHFKHNNVCIFFLLVRHAPDYLSLIVLKFCAAT